jgi:hypothetical protein
MAYSFHELGALPSWVTGTGTVMGFSDRAPYLVRFPLFKPPLVVHAPLIITRIVMLIRTP